MIESILRALGDPALLEIVALSFRVTGVALVLAVLSGVPLGAVVGLTRFPGKRLVTLIFYTCMGLPPVVVGLFVYMMLSRSGPFGSLGWLFTPAGMILAQVILALPLVAGLTQTAVEAVDRDLRLQIRALGATPWQSARVILGEARIGVTAATMAAFGGIISEVGAVMLVGGNIDGQTRVLTTAIVLSTRQGDFALAMALGLVLLLLTLGANALLLQLQGRPR
jgi:tungstate transport system permease protein